MAMASCSLHVKPFLTLTSCGKRSSSPFVFVFDSCSLMENFFHRFRFFGKNACAHEIRMYPRSRMNMMMIKWGAHLYEDKRIRLDGFEELTEYVVNERYQILVRLFFRKRFLFRQNGLEQVQGGYLAEQSAEAGHESHSGRCRLT